MPSTKPPRPMPSSTPGARGLCSERKAPATGCLRRRFVREVATGGHSGPRLAEQDLHGVFALVETVDSCFDLRLGVRALERAELECDLAGPLARALDDPGGIRPERSAFPGVEPVNRDQRPVAVDVPKHRACASDVRVVLPFEVDRYLARLTCCLSAVLATATGCDGQGQGREAGSRDSQESTIDERETRSDHEAPSTRCKMLKTRLPHGDACAELSGSASLTGDGICLAGVVVRAFRRIEHVVHLSLRSSQEPFVVLVVLVVIVRHFVEWHIAV